MNAILKRTTLPKNAIKNGNFPSCVDPKNLQKEDIIADTGRKTNFTPETSESIKAAKQI